MGKRKVISEEDFGNMVLPVANNVLGIAVQMLGNDRMRALARRNDVSEKKTSFLPLKL